MMSPAAKAKRRERDRQRSARKYAADPVGRAALVRASYQRHRAAILARLKEKRMDPIQSAKQRAADKRYYHSHKDHCRDYHFKRRYGISLAEYNALATEQCGRCAICDTVPGGKGKKGTLHVDHDHDSGVTRGLLCDTCNRALGLFKDSVQTLTKAAMYVQQFAKKAESA